LLVVGITASALSDDVEAYLEAGADMVLSKPLQTDKLDGILKFVSESGSISRVGHRLVKFQRGLEWVPHENVTAFEEKNALP